MTNNKLEILKNLTILLIDDDEILLKDLEATLAIFFNKVLTAPNGAKALDIYRTNNVDMIITDYVMPIMDGYEFCCNMRREDTKIPIVIMSNYTDKEKLLQSIPLNLTQYLIKPIDYNTLVDTLLQLIQKIESSDISIQFINKIIKYNTITKELTEDEKPIVLSKSEIRTLDILLKLKNTLVTNDMISDAIDNEEIKSNQAIKNIIYRLRQKVGKDNIANVPSFGYILRIT